MSPSAARPGIAGIPGVATRRRPKKSTRRYLCPVIWRGRRRFSPISSVRRQRLCRRKTTPGQPLLSSQPGLAGAAQSRTGTVAFVAPMPLGKPRGGAVLLDGLTDSPAARAIWRNSGSSGVNAAGGAAFAGDTRTAPGGVNGGWLGEHWLAATRLAVRKATRLAGRTCRCIWSATLTGGALRAGVCPGWPEDPPASAAAVLLLSPIMA